MNERKKAEAQISSTITCIICKFVRRLETQGIRVEEFSIRVFVCFLWFVENRIMYLFENAPSRLLVAFSGTLIYAYSTTTSDKF